VTRLTEHTPRRSKSLRESGEPSAFPGVPPKVVSERLGHSSPAFTMTVYQRVLPGMEADAAATLRRRLRSEAFLTSNFLTLGLKHKIDRSG
jgi:integrase